MLEPSRFIIMYMFVAFALVSAWGCCGAKLSLHALNMAGGMGGTSVFNDPMERPSAVTYVDDDGRSRVALTGSCYGGHVCAVSCLLGGSQAMYCPAVVDLSANLPALANINMTRLSSVIVMDDQGARKLVIAGEKHAPGPLMRSHVVVANLTVGGGLVASHEFQGCGSAFCGREVRVGTSHLGHILLVSNSNKPLLLGFTLSGVSVIPGTDLTTGGGPLNAVSNTGIEPRFTVDVATGRGLAISSHNIGAAMLLCFWPFTITGATTRTLYGHSCTTSYTPPVPAITTPVFDAAEATTMVGFNNGTVVLFRLNWSTKVLSSTVIAGMPDFSVPPPGFSSPPPPQGMPPMLFGDFELWPQIVGGAPSMLFTASAYGLTYVAQLDDAASSVIESTNSSHIIGLTPPSFPTMISAQGAVGWNGGLFLGWDTGANEFLPVALVTPPANALSLSPATVVPLAFAAQPPPFGPVDVLDPTRIGGMFNVSGAADDDLAWLGLLGASLSWSITNGYQSCDVFESRTTGTFAFDPPWISGYGLTNSVVLKHEAGANEWALSVSDAGVTGAMLGEIARTALSMHCQDGDVRLPPTTAKNITFVVRDMFGTLAPPLSVYMPEPQADAIFAPKFVSSAGEWMTAGRSVTVRSAIMAAEVSTTDATRSSGLFDTSLTMQPIADPRLFANVTFTAGKTAGFAASDIVMVETGSIEVLVAGVGVYYEVEANPSEAGTFFIFPSGSARPAEPQLWAAPSPPPANGLDFGFTATNVSAEVVIAGLRSLAVYIGGSPVVSGMRTVELKYSYVYKPPALVRQVSMGSVMIDVAFSGVGPPPVFNMTACGDGVVNGDVEACDDGNTVNGDGCSDGCVVEPGYECFIPPIGSAPPTPPAPPSPPMPPSVPPSPPAPPMPVFRPSVCATVATNPGREQRSDLFEINTDPATSTVAWTAYFLAAVAIAVAAMTVYKRTMNSTEMPDNHVKASLFTKLVREHSVLGIIFVHRSDPFAAGPRVVALVLQLNITYATSVAILIMFKDEEGSITGYALSAIVSSLLSVLMGLALFKALAGGVVSALSFSALNAFLILGNELFLPKTLVDYHQSVLIAFAAGLFTDFTVVEPVTILIKRFLWLESSVFQLDESPAASPYKSAVAPMETYTEPVFCG
ncbi:uncharacterized protein AMSG_02464 [Thecamonas trahens ATCC 50062]|uniref:DUF4215 domain-containing protein n=1 Tax=Thecamonas trahens ATCC 50062 TaxID=461836 RepID=A0A0L0D5T1_THETB|nr:hypothetical protein AMSG_02464 [Thecamonas trahens ATCC 50062]KNC47446.1 hypothetical protein AMSG_02464 [Thecamonas trahens ATCC 50062]|eukprot:XP_013759383.1 hypothetical protein AMSG_02464 [Thecamonas trahens ATCC 50062]